MSRYILGIDGGGTKTAFYLADIEERQVYAHTAKDCCHFHHGTEGFKEGISRGIQAVLEQAQAGYKDVSAVCAGLSSFGESQDDDEQLTGILRGMFRTPHVLAVNDSQVSLAGSLELKPGIVVICGTGSMALGKDSYGNMARSGGWGEIIGDEGSAYWLGRKVLEICSKQADGRLKKGALYETVMHAFGLKDGLDLIGYTYKNIGNVRDKIAALSPLLHEAAQKGDTEAIRAFGDAGQELFAMVKAVAAQLDFKGTIDVSCSGGVFKAGRYIIEPMESLLLGLNGRLLRPRLSPAAGAVLLAGELLGNTAGLSAMLYEYENIRAAGNRA